MARAKPKAASPADLRFAAYSEAYWNLFEEALIGKCWLELPEAEHTPKNWVAHKRKALETVTEAKAKRRVPGVASPQELAAACRRVLSKLHTIDDWEDFLDRRTDEELAEFAYDTLSPKAIVRAIWALMSTIGAPPRPTWPTEKLTIPVAIAAIERVIEWCQSPVEPETPQGKKSVRKRTRKPDKMRPLTEKQQQAFEMVVECNGNKTQAAKRLSIDRSTLDQHYDAASAKIEAIKSPRGKRTKSLPLDSRGQANVTNADHERRR